MTDYEWLTSMNLCHRCRKEKTTPGKKYCFECLEKIREENRKRYDSQKAKEYQPRRRKIYQEKKLKGICIRCSKVATHGLYCYECSIKEKRKNQYKAQREKRLRNERGLIPDKRKEMGLCKWCAQPAMPGKHCCEACSKRFSEAGKKGYQQNLINKNNPWINEAEEWKKKNKLMNSESI